MTLWECLKIWSLDGRFALFPFALVPLFLWLTWQEIDTSYSRICGSGNRAAISKPIVVRGSAAHR
jgi:hypothetical protein